MSAYARDMDFNDLSIEDNDVLEQLKSQALKKFEGPDRIDVPKFTYKASVVALHKHMDYGDFDAYDLGDTLNIPPERVVRHYDASRKNCPATMRPNDWARWYDFKRKLTEEGILMSREYDELNGRLSKVENPMIYNYMDENMPEWAKPTVQKLMDKGALKGNERGELGLTEELLRVLVINDRMGVYGE